MTDTAATVDEVAAGNGASPLASQSILDVLRARRAETAAHETVDLAVPGYKGDLVARYHLIGDARDLDKIGQNVRKGFRTDIDRIVNTSIDLLIEACNGLYGKSPDSGELVSLADTGDPVCYDARCAEMFGIDINPQSPARSILRGMFFGNENAIIEHAQLLQRWMADTSVEVDETLGEA